MLQFLEGNQTTKAIAWVDKNDGIEDIQRELNLNVVTKVTRNDLFSTFYDSIIENKYLYLATFIVLRNIFGSNKYKLIPTEWWVNKLQITTLEPLFINIWNYFNKLIINFQNIIKLIYT